MQKGRFFEKIRENGVQSLVLRAGDLTKSEKYGKVKTAAGPPRAAKEAILWLSMKGKTASLPRMNG